MKKLYSIMLMAIAMLGVSFSAKADVYTVNLTWDTPGSVEIYVASTAAESKVNLPEGATSYTAQYEQSYAPSTYVRATDGYYLVNAVCSDDSKTITPSGSPRQAIINMGTASYAHGTHTVHVNVEKLNYDSSIEINFISGGDVTATTELQSFKLKGGKQTMKFDARYEKTLNFGNGTPDLAEDYYIKKNDEVQTWTNFYGMRLQSSIPFEDGDWFEVKYNNEPAEAAKATYTVSLNYLDDMAKESIVMVRNFTKMQTISSYDSFEVEEGDVVSIACNTADYNVTINDDALEPASGISTTTLWKSEAITANTTINISAEERQYGNTYLSVGIVDPEGVVLHKGGVDGPVIDLSELTPSPETIYGTEFNVYSIEVSLKSPKIYVAEAPGWYIYQSGYNNPASTSETSGFISTQMAMQGDDYKGALHVWTHKIVKDTKLVVVLKGDASKAALKDQHNNSNDFPLQLGYNEFMIDPVYSGTFTVAKFDVAEGSSFSVYNNYTAQAVDENDVYSGIAVNSDAVLHIFAGVPESKKHTYTIANKTIKQAEVTYDRVLKATGEKFSAYVGSEISVKPAAGYLVKIDDEVAPSSDGVFTATVPDGAFNTHDIEIVDPSTSVISPANGETAESFDGFTISFPNATTATYDEAADFNEYFTLQSTYWANWGWTIEKVETDYPTFKLTPNMTAPNGNLTFKMYEGFFTINDALKNSERTVKFNLNRTVDLDGWTVTPEGDVVASEYYGPQVAFSFGEDASVEFNIEDPTLLSIKFNNETLEYYTDYQLNLEGGYIMIGLGDEYKNMAGTLEVSFPAGAFKVNGKESHAMAHTWNVIMPKEYTLNMTPGFNPEAVAADTKLVFTATFPEADKAELFNKYFIELREGYQSDSYSSTPATVEAVADADHPTFTITFPATGKEVENANFTLKIIQGAFTLDGAQESPAFEEVYAINPVDPTEYVLTPASGDTVEGITEIMISFPKAKTVTLADGSEEGETSEIMLMNTNSTYWSEWFTIGKVAGAEVPTFLLTPNAPAKTNGQYNFVISAEQFLINGTEKNDEIIAQYTVYKEIKPEDITYTLYPEDGTNIDNLYSADLAIKYADGLSVDMESTDMDKISLKFGNTDLEAGTDYTADGYMSIISFSIDRNVYKDQNGKLIMDLGEGWIKVSGVNSPAIHAEWNVVGETDGIGSILGDETDSFTVVTIDGRVIMTEGTAAELKQLPAGLYIINGVKIYLTK
ncbi:MAG: hypothetical protein NC102_11310 [Clostridium sp.]|nr:hypothetical protein [Bacteroides sp.]MCM1452838.1 hypothetical protein [Clostridium sp.]